MLTYDLEKRGSLARYDYLYRCIKEDILSGRLKAGEKLPSKRALADHLKISKVTVETAYAQLAAEAGLDLSGLTVGGFLLGNLLPVTIGNVLGGAGLGGLLWYCYRPKS